MKNKILIIINNFFIIPILTIFITHLIYVKLNNYNTLLYIPSLFLSLIICIGVLFILNSFTKKSYKSIIILQLLNILLFLGNQYKIIYEGVPVFVSDLYFFGNASNIKKFIGNSFINNTLSILPYALILVIGSIILVIISKKVNIEFTSTEHRIINFMIGIVIISSLIIPVKFTKNTYLNLFFLGSNKKDYNSYTTYTTMYAYYGIIGGIYNQYLESQFVKPEKYDNKKLTNMINSTKVENKNNIGNPNIIVILSESYFDVSLLEKDIKFNKEITKNFNTIKNYDNSYLVNMISPTYGGMTANVVFELLTGNNMSYFSDGYIPFMQLYNENKEYPSLVKELNNNDYNSSIILASDSYKSNNTYKKIGFKDFKLLNNKKKSNLKGPYVSDEYVTQEIIKYMDNHKNKKNFIMTETMQSHMDYYKSKYDNYDINIENSTLPKNDQEALLSYSQGIYDADKTIKTLYDYINSIDEDTIVIFFGDHLPYIRNNNNENVLDKLDYFNTKDNLKNIYRKYNTQTLIFSNYDLKLDIDYSLGYDLLLTNITNQMDIKISNYYNWLNQTNKSIQAYNKYIGIENNKLKYRSDFSSKSKELISTKEKLTYKYFIDN